MSTTTQMARLIGTDNHGAVPAIHRDVHLHLIAKSLAGIF
jgi:hypothetical protein